MTEAPNSPQSNPMSDIVEKVNTALRDFSEKDWNYSRISLVNRQFSILNSRYILKLEVLDLDSKQGRTDLKTLSDEVKWGDRHSSELGMLEVVSLRINKALLEITSDQYWLNKRPVVRIVKSEDVPREQDASVLWYQITEVAGEDFDNR